MTSEELMKLLEDVQRWYNLGKPAGQEPKNETVAQMLLDLRAQRGGGMEFPGSGSPPFAGQAPQAPTGPGLSGAVSDLRSKLVPGGTFPGEPSKPIPWGDGTQRGSGEFPAPGGGLPSLPSGPSMTQGTGARYAPGPVGPDVWAGRPVGGSGEFPAPGGGYLPGDLAMGKQKLQPGGNGAFLRDPKVGDDPKVYPEQGGFPWGALLGGGLGPAALPAEAAVNTDGPLRDVPDYVKAAEGDLGIRKQREFQKEVDAAWDKPTTDDKLARLFHQEETPPDTSMTDFLAAQQQPDVGAAKAQEQELAAMMAMSEAFHNIGQSPTANEILLGLPGGKDFKAPAALERESQALARRRQTLEDRAALPEWQADSPVSQSAREVLEKTLGQKIPDNLSAAQIREHFGPVGGIFTEGEKLKEARRTAGQIEEGTVKDLAKSRAGLTKIKNLEASFPEIDEKLGPFMGRWNTLAAKVGFDDAKGTALAATMRQIFADYLYGTAGKQLSDREVAFMEKAFFQSYHKGTTVREMAAAVQRNMLENHNSLLTELAASGRNVRPHLLPGYQMDDDTFRIYFSPKGAGKVKIPRTERRALKEAKEQDVEYEVTE